MPRIITRIVSALTLTISTLPALGGGSGGGSGGGGGSEVGGGRGGGGGGQQVFDFSTVTTLAAGAVDGVGVAQPVPGFDLLILHDGRAVYWQSFGAWSLGRPASADSASKTISGALVMAVVDSAVQPMTLQSRLADFLPEFNTPAKSAITIAQCFAHTSGLRTSSAISDPSLTLRQAAAEIAADPLSFAPGAMFAYGGTSMHAAGAAVEVAGGARWNELFAARLALPLGLVTTRFVLTTPDNPRIAGGCESNSVEFARFMEMLRRGGMFGSTRILSESAVAQMFTRQTAPGIPIASSPLDGSSDYGVGVWLDQRTASGALIGAQAAGARGFSSWIDFDDRIVGVFATDRTVNSNIQPVLTRIRAAAEQAVRSPLACPADFNRNATVSVQDLFDFLAAYFAGDPRADINGFAGITVQDIFDFLAAYFTGC